MVDPKLLKGLKYHWSEGRLVEKDGRTMMEYTPHERDLRPEDILASKDYGDKIVIVTADGKKYELPKKGGG